ncbi:hypothetical protein ANN_18551 [Periplaneta americana]|uniref:ShKT domain-containing protein n=1 Tax=Periplaneta americana TaxID=6978 RepID=A0ABQ8SP24_PERAM|nr:hypothetical protein ANN_18551 [Periplaneta americana]
MIFREAIYQTDSMASLFTRSKCPRKCVVGGEENCERDDKYNATSADHKRCTLEYYRGRLASCIFTSTVPETPDRIHTP